MKRILFNAMQPEESRVAIVDGQKLINLDIETAGKEQRKGNIYKGVVTKVEPSLEACFVDYGTGKSGFLPCKEIHRSYFRNPVRGRAKIQEIVKEGDELLVQVDKDARGNKGATLTTYISLAGRYLVLMPNNPKAGGVSRRIEGEERQELKELVSQLCIPKGMSVIVRTAGIGRSLQELKWDLDYQLKLWEGVLEASQQPQVKPLILQESALIIRTIRDYYQPDIGEILVDHPEAYQKIYQFISYVLPDSIDKVKLYKETTPLFTRFQIENQIDSVYARQVSLPSGGEIVIDHSEALVSIDVNSAKATRGSDVEETALKTNLEAAEEICRQIRLRDIGGLIIIDFIDMESLRHQRAVESAMRDYLKEDRARVQTTRLSKFGLMEMSRQRLQMSLGESTHMVCPRCSGTGVIRSVQSSSLHILRIIHEKAMKENTGEVRAQLPIEVATFLLNEKREQLFHLEDSVNVPIIIIPNKYLEVPHFHVERVRAEDVTNELSSYRMVEKPVEEDYQSSTQLSKSSTQQQAAVQGIKPETPAPIPKKVKKSIWSGFTSWLGHIFESEHEDKKATKAKKTATGHYFGLEEKSSVTEYRSRANERPAISEHRKSISQGIESDKVKNNKTAFTTQATDAITEIGKFVETNNQGEHHIEHHKRQHPKKEYATIDEEKTQQGKKSICVQQMANDSAQEEKLKHKVDEKEALFSGSRQRGDRNRAMRRSSGHRILSANYMERRIRIDKIVRYINKINQRVWQMEHGELIQDEEFSQEIINELPKQQSIESLDIDSPKTAQEKVKREFKAGIMTITTTKMKKPALTLVETRTDKLHKTPKSLSTAQLQEKKFSGRRRNDLVIKELIPVERNVAMEQIETQNKNDSA